MISLNPISAGIDLVMGIVNRVWPDKTEQQKQQLAAAMAADDNFTALMTGQMKVNEVEAAHSSLFVAGWRPFVGWVCGLSFAWQFLLQPLFTFLIVASGHPAPAMPILDFVTMSTVLMGMLGLGAMRSYDKKNGI